MTPRYRADIDGLRAMAVLPVVLFHAGVPGFSGGYVGVDVFFVISGFLMTQIIVREIDAGTFALLRFYERRARRILPAFFVLLVAVFAAGYMLLLPDDFVALGWSAISALFSVANIHFFLQSGYFDESAVTKPLLHIWSLAVEEQFYLLFPLILLLLKRRSEKLVKSVMCGLAALSFAASALLTISDQPSAFYMLPTRAWELLAGGLMALHIGPPVSSRSLREAGAISGALLIALPVFFFDATTLFPSPGALLPVLGAALVIHLADGTTIGEVLGSRLMRAVGLISYSLYLWHWPIIVFLTYRTGVNLDAISIVLALGLSLAAAIFSWRLVETPFRTRKEHPSRYVWWSASLATATLLGCATIVVASNGLPGRLPVEATRIASKALRSPLRRKCHGEATRPVNTACIIGDRSVSPTVAVWADSHGVELAFALGEIGRKQGFSVLQITASACPPGLDTDFGASARCPQHNLDAFTRIQDSGTINTVVLAAYFEFEKYKADADFARGLEHAVQRLLEAGKQVVLIGPVPAQPFVVPRQLARAAATMSLEPSGVATSLYLSRNKQNFALLRRFKAQGATTVFPHKLFCKTQTCAIKLNDKILYFDANHLSVDGARLLARRIAPLFKPAGEPSLKDAAIGASR